MLIRTLEVGDELVLEGDIRVTLLGVAGDAVLFEIAMPPSPRSGDPQVSEGRALLEREAFDLVVASHVLHATIDLRQTLQHTQELLAPGGTLLLVETLRPVARGWTVTGIADDLNSPRAAAGGPGLMLSSGSTQ